MKNLPRIIYSAKFIFLSVTIIGMLFRLQRWTGSSEILIIGLSSLAFLFMLELKMLKKKRIADYLWFIGMSVLCIGYLYTVQHWFGANNLLYTGMAAAAVGFVLRYINPVKTEGEEQH